MEEKVKKRYPGIRPFQDTEIDQAVFKGRPDEIQQLLHLILAEKLVVLFAKSGVGKSLGGTTVSRGAISFSLPLSNNATPGQVEMSSLFLKAQSNS